MRVARNEAFSRSDRAFVFGHRGARATAPENTLASFSRAIDLGADGLELDVRLARDLVPVVHHDELLDRTTGARGPVADRTSGELGLLDAGFHFGAEDGFPFRGQGIGVPTLGEVLARYPAVPIIVEMKGDDPRLPACTLETVRSAGALDRVCFGAFSRKLLRQVRGLAPGSVTSASREEIRWALYRAWIGWRLRSPAYRVCQPPDRFRGRRVLTPRLVRFLHAAGIPVQTWTINDAAAVRELLDWGVDGIISDKPDVAAAAVREWGRRSGRAAGGER